MKTFYVVKGNSTYYDEGNEWIVGISNSKFAAKSLADKAQKWANKHEKDKTALSPYDPYYQGYGILPTYDIEECYFFNTVAEFKKEVPKIQRRMAIEIQKATDKILANQKKK